MSYSNLIKTHILLIAASLVFLSGCGKEEEISMGPRPPAVAPRIHQNTAQQAKAAQRYRYKGDAFRDPFIALTGSGISMGGLDEVPVPSLGSLALKGIVYDKSSKAAIIQGGGITYILKDNRLFDNRNRIVKGMTGIIKQESVLMIAPDKTTKELLLRQKEE